MQVIQSLAAVFSVLLLLALALWWLRRRGLAQFGSPGARTMHRLQLLERLSLTPQHSLLLVRVDGKTVLIALSPSGCCLLEPAWSHGPAEVAR
ncbi:MAG TPA: flagellar biosynthetic protein FliO [Bryobacteraceae bacterium]|nr:flagellar biosynthetic protein FliO [Bryobacteraceae bacterium]